MADGRKQLVLTGQEHYLSKDGCHRILAELRRDVLEPYGAFAVGETVFVNIPQAKDLCDPERGELDMVFSFEHMECDQIVVKWFKTRLQPKKLMQTLTKWQTGLGWNACYFENHDQPRFISRFSDSQNYRREASMMTAGLLMTLRGTPYIFEGQEIGMTNGDFLNLQEVEDIESHNVYAMAKGLGIPAKLRWKMIQRTSRDNARTPMQWTGGENAGFSTGKPWLKINGNYPRVNVEKELADPEGVLAFWRYMIRLRKENPVLCSGDFVPVYQGKAVFAFERVLEGKRLLSVCNMTGKTVKLPKPLGDWTEVVASNYDSLSAETMQPFEFRLMEA